MTVVPLVVLGTFSLLVLTKGEGWWRGLGVGSAALAATLSVHGWRRTQRLRVVVDGGGARIVGGDGRAASGLGAAWAEIASGGIERRSVRDGRGRRLLVLKDATGRDRFQLSNQLCGSEAMGRVAAAVRSNREARGKPFAMPADWP